MAEKDFSTAAYSINDAEGNFDMNFTDADGAAADVAHVVAAVSISFRMFFLSRNYHLDQFLFRINIDVIRIFGLMAHWAVTDKIHWKL